MQLIARSTASALGAGVVMLATRAGAEEGRVVTEVAAYHDSVAVSVLTPSVTATVDSPTSGWSANGQYLVDIVSAASPDIVSTASARWVEVRNAGGVGGAYKPGDYGVAIGAVASTTPDYLSLGAYVRFTEDLDEKNLTLTEGYAFGHDTIGRTGTPFSVFSHTLIDHTISASLTKIVNESTIVGGGIEAIFENGDQSKPYRFIPMFAPSVAETIPRGASADSIADARLTARPLEQLPLSRVRYALTGRVAVRLARSTVRVDERLYDDTWNLHASTTDAKWLFDIGERVILWPQLRFHQQDSVSFWQRAYSARDVHDLPALRTGDRELGALTTLGLGAGARVAIGAPAHKERWVLVFGIDGAYTSFADAIYVKDRTAALVSSGVEFGF